MNHPEIGKNAVDSKKAKPTRLNKSKFGKTFYLELFSRHASPQKITEYI